MSSTDEIRVALLLTNRLFATDEKPLSPGEFWRLASRMESLGELLDVGGPEIADAVGVDADLGRRLESLLRESALFDSEVARLSEEGVTVLSALDDRFPKPLVDRLGALCPPILLVAGPLEWMTAGGLGVAGSRDAAAGALDATRDAAEMAAGLGRSTISGLARGVDQVGLDGATRCGGRAVGVPAQGIEVVLRSREVRQQVDAGEMCVTSPYGPTARFTAGTAMGRNKIVYALSDVAFVASSAKESGGTWSGAVEAMKRNLCPVGSWVGDGSLDGNHALVELGAHPIDRVDRLFAPIPSRPGDSDTEAEQTTLF